MKKIILKVAALILIGSSVIFYSFSSPFFFKKVPSDACKMRLNNVNHYFNNDSLATHDTLFIPICWELDKDLLSVSNEKLLLEVLGKPIFQNSDSLLVSFYDFDLFMYSESIAEKRAQNLYSFILDQKSTTIKVVFHFHHNYFDHSQASAFQQEYGQNRLLELRAI